MKKVTKTCLIDSCDNILKRNSRSFCSVECFALSLKGKPTWNKGKTLSEEHKRKDSEALKGRIISEEHRNKISEALKGKKKSEEHKKKLRVPKSEEHVKNVSNALKGKYVGENNPFYGKKHTEEIKQKLRESNLGKKTSEETKQKSSNSHKELWKNKEFVDKMMKFMVDGGKHLKGYFYSFKNNKEIFYGSSYELEAYKILEDSAFVKSYDKCHFFIPYEFEGETKRYIPDILVEYISGIKEIIEVKPNALLTYKKNPFKFEALKNYGEINKLKTTIWTEKELFVEGVC